MRQVRFSEVLRIMIIGKEVEAGLSMIGGHRRCLVVAHPIKGAEEVTNIITNRIVE